MRRETTFHTKTVSFIMMASSSVVVKVKQSRMWRNWPLSHMLEAGKRKLFFNHPNKQVEWGRRVRKFHPDFGSLTPEPLILLK